MLVLSRKVGEKLVIDGNITVVINRIAGNRITLGIEAPSDVHIVRGELHAIRSEFAGEKPASMGNSLPVNASTELSPVKAAS